MVLALALILSVSCGDGSGTAAETGGQVRGLVVEAVGRSLTEVETVKIRDQAGKLWNFTGDARFIGISAAHLREHQLAGESVAVTYVSRGGLMVAVDIRD